MDKRLRVRVLAYDTKFYWRHTPVVSPMYKSTGWAEKWAKKQVTKAYFFYEVLDITKTPYKVIMSGESPKLFNMFLRK